MKDAQSRHVADVLGDYGVRLALLEHVVAALAAGAQSRAAIVTNLERMREELLAEFPALVDRRGAWSLLERLRAVDDDGPS